MTIRRLIVPLAVAIVTMHGGQALAQGAFPAPLPGQTVQKNDPAFPPVPGQTVQRNDPAFPPVNGQAVQRNDPAFPPVNGAAASVSTPPSPFPTNGVAPVLGSSFARPPGPPPAGPSDECTKGFLTLRAEAEKRGKLIKAASERHASPEEACKLIRNFSQAESKMVNYVEAHSAKCGIPAQVTEQLKTGHKNTENMQTKVCQVAQQQQQRAPAGPSLSEVLGSSAALPEATPTKKGGSTFDTLNGNVLTR